MSGIVGGTCALAALDSPVQVIPSTLPDWRWAAITYLLVRRDFLTNPRSLVVDRLCREHIRIAAVRAVDNGEHRL